MSLLSQLLFCLVFETRSHVAQGGLALTIFLLQPHTCYECAIMPGLCDIFEVM